jgi:hypothetical protein
VPAPITERLPLKPRARKITAASMPRKYVAPHHAYQVARRSGSQNAKNSSASHNLTKMPANKMVKASICMRSS